jgi:hypothetical protein
MLHRLITSFHQRGLNKSDAADVGFQPSNDKFVPALTVSRVVDHLHIISARPTIPYFVHRSDTRLLRHAALLSVLCEFDVLDCIAAEPLCVVAVRMAGKCVVGCSVRFRARAESGSHDAGEEASDRPQYSRHASANNAQIGLQTSPQPYVVVVVRYVGEVVQCCQVLQTDGAADCHEETDEKSQTNSHSASPIDLKLDKLRNR